MLLSNSQKQNISPYQLNSKILQQSQYDYIQYLKSLLPIHVLQSDIEQDQQVSKHQSSPFSDQKWSVSRIKNKASRKITQMNCSSASMQNSRGWSVKGTGTGKWMGTGIEQGSGKVQNFILSIIKTIAKQKCLEQYSHGFGPVMKELGINIKQIQALDTQQMKIQAMLAAIDRNIEEQRKRFNGTKNDSHSFNKENNQVKGSSANKLPLYNSFLKEQSKQNVDTFPWLEIDTKYPMIEKKLKSKLIQSINQDTNQKRIRQLLQRKAKNNKNSENFSAALDDQKVEIQNQSLFLQEFQNNKIEYIWTHNDDQMFKNNLKVLKKKCKNKGDFIKICGRFNYISQRQFETLASQQISRKLNKNNKICLSREFLLDKYYSTTQVLTQQEMRFILKTSPMLCKSVDRNFVKKALKNIKYENISDLQLKIADDIIGKFQKLQSSVKEGRINYKNYTNQLTKSRLQKFQQKQNLLYEQAIAKRLFSKHKSQMHKALKYNPNQDFSCKKKFQRKKTQQDFTKKAPIKSWNPYNKCHVGTGLFVKDCNQQCTDDLYNEYEREYLQKRLGIGIGKNSSEINPKKEDPQHRVKMINFYSGGPNQQILTNFNQTRQDIENICNAIKAQYFEKNLVIALQSIQIDQNAIFQPIIKNEAKCALNMLDFKTKKTLAMIPDEDFETMAKRKLIENHEKAKAAVYVSKLLFLSAENSLQNLKALNPNFTKQQVNTKDKKGNTALFYVTRYANQDFIDFLLKFGADPNIRCENRNTSMHMAFKSNNVNLILKLLASSQNEPNLNILNQENKTPLAYASRQVLKKLGLQKGVTCVDPQSRNQDSFDNNLLLQGQDFDKVVEQRLEAKDPFMRSVEQSKSKFNKAKAVTSIKNVPVLESEFAL